MSGFFSEGLDDKYHSLRLLLEWFYPSRPVSDYNLEEVLAFLDLERHRRESWSSHESLSGWSPEELFRDVLAFVVDRLSIPPDRVCPLHSRLIDTLEPRDTILTLNYDHVVDNVLIPRDTKPKTDYPDQDSRSGKLTLLVGEASFMGGRPPTLMPRETDQGFYLKLHGSLDWLFCTTSGCPNHTRVFAARLERLRDGQVPGKPCRLCGAALVQLIIPPIASKRIEDRGRLAFLWHLALQELREASRLIIVGVSFAPSDFELRWLIRSALMGTAASPNLSEVFVVNPSLNARQAAMLTLPRNRATLSQYANFEDLLNNTPCSVP